MNWKCTAIKGPIDLTKVDITFFTGGLAMPEMKKKWSGSVCIKCGNPMLAWNGKEWNCRYCGWKLV